MTSVYAYVRVSTEAQRDSGLGLEAQRERCRTFAAGAGVDILETVTDVCSGSVEPERRTGLSWILADLEARRPKATGILVVRLDRLSRSTRDLVDLVERSQKHGWRLMSASESLDTSSPAGRLVVTVLGAVAQLEREIIGERTREALAVLGREGKRRSGKPPFGFRFDAGALVSDDLEQSLLARMLDLRSRGHGARVIAGELQTGGITNPRTGRRFDPSTVHGILATAERASALAARTA